jgi:hypothetical protein
MALSKKQHGCCLVARCCQEKVSRFAFFVDGTIEIFPGAFDLYIGLVYSLASADRPLVFAKYLF